VSPEGRRPDLSNLVQVPRFLGPRPTEARAVAGCTPGGEGIEHHVAGDWTLLLFLSTTCDGCTDLWEAFARPNDAVLGRDVDVVLVTRPPTVERPEEVRRLAGDATVVMSEAAWSDYEVHSGPFFVLIDGRARRTASEGVAWSIEQMRAAISAVRPDGRGA
jgi:hypothetical protein